MDWAEKTVDEKAPGGYQFNLDIFYKDEIQNHPGFINVKERMNFPKT